jgi:hypothetical protein
MWHKKLLPKISRISLSPALKTRRQKKSMHGQFYRELERTSADKEKSMVWLCSSGIKGVTESLTIATQDQALNMCYNQRNIMKQPTDSKFRTWYKAEEHMKHIVVGLTALHHLNTLINTKRWPVTSTGRRVNLPGYRLPTSTMNI